jgi:PPP family 3-phenylpropionic acid transporter
MRAGEAERERRSFAVRVSLMFAAIAAIIGTNLPFLPLWLDWTGLGPREIAIITSAPLFVRVAATPLIAFAADQAGDHRRFLVALAWAGVAALLLLSQARGFWPILGCMIVFAIAWTTIMPLTETVAMSGVKLAGLDYGRMRLWGSLGFIAASTGGGWVVETLGPASAIWLIITGAVLTAAAAHGLRRPIRAGRPGTTTRPPRLDPADALALLRSRIFLTFLLAGGAGSAAHAVFYTFGTLHWQAQGLSAEWAGRLWAISIVAEVALFAYSRAVVARLGAVGLIVLGGAAGVVRWFVMGLDPPLLLLVTLQVLHVFTFGAAHLGAVHFIARAVPEGQAGTGQALYAAVTGGLGMGLAVMLAGSLYADYAGRAYWAMAALAGVSLLASLLLMRAWGRGTG